ncbi:lipid IV(A) 3-deoxy-D-manno-octulosonic acid transferase [uncultured Paraglaciecola sp.]|uniref:lipid IV(A) 3-deoxy-D-manno-octulosonic acid transferase n=1 Tax=uncultured Paraglaciecola sp. TaxID=1765024 RepID=UPI002595FC4C|nr:lipid IV(A) 3-deoxy-D-manno-octulosonic acid transferase [uncultured Paraglaciecola sp.]
MRKYLYNSLIRILVPLLLLRLWIKGKQAPDYRLRWRERLGYFKTSEANRHGICFHCVSVGEANAAAPLIKQLQQQFPYFPITITTTTPTGSDQVRRMFGDSVFHIYLPFDTPGAIKRFYQQTQPKLLVIFETELWPNLLHFAQKFRIKTLLANARLSEKSALGYQKAPTLSRKMMADISLIAAHAQQDANRFLKLGLTPNKLAITGSIKFDISIDKHLKQQSQQLKQQWLAPSSYQRPIWVAGSTHEGEEELILSSYKQALQTQPHLLLVLVPRHQERFEQVAELVHLSGLNYIKRSDGSLPDASTQVILGDTMGELLLFWALADIAFVGGSLVQHGGHNPLEPSALDVPVISGKHVFNFKQIYQSLQTSNAVLMVENPVQLTNAVLQLLAEKRMRQNMCKNATLVISENQGATGRLNQHICQILAA